MKNTTLFQHNFSEVDWQNLGELELDAGSDTDEAMRTWLIELLIPLNLHTAFISRVLLSAQDCAVRSTQTATIKLFGHMHLRVFVPKENASKGKAWGFFHIERIANRVDGMEGHDHAIDFYLYGEGE